jgi:hypothetical protein
MINFNKSSFGQYLRVNFGQDVSTATAFSLEMQPENGEKVTKTPTLGTSNVDVGDETFLANQYVEYATEEDVFNDHVGRWRVKATATLPAATVSTDYVLFRVTG